MLQNLVMRFFSSVDLFLQLPPPTVLQGSERVVRLCRALLPARVGGAVDGRPASRSSLSPSACRLRSPGSMSPDGVVHVHARKSCRATQASTTCTVFSGLHSTGRLNTLHAMTGCQKHSPLSPAAAAVVGLFLCAEAGACNRTTNSV